MSSKSPPVGSGAILYWGPYACSGGNAVSVILLRSFQVTRLQKSIDMQQFVLGIRAAHVQEAQLSTLGRGLRPQVL